MAEWKCISVQITAKACKTLKVFPWTWLADHATHKFLHNTKLKQNKIITWKVVPRKHKYPGWKPEYSANWAPSECHQMSASVQGRPTLNDGSN